MQQTKPLKMSIVVPVYNGATTLPNCLEAILLNRLEEAEIVVVNDHSTDHSASIATGYGVRVLNNPGGRGPASARNFGAQHSNGAILFFVDSDVVVKNNTVADMMRVFEDHPQVAAAFGSYDDQPGCSNFLSQYKNLFHHFVHQSSVEQASTFWAGCGAIRKEAFKAMGGFNDVEYTKAQIEDIELGVRMWNKHLPVRLEKNIQVKHLKRWTPIGLLKADILYRAIPWSKLILQSRRMPGELNLLPSHRISALLVGCLAFLLVLMPVAYWGFHSPRWILVSMLAATLLIVAVLLFLNRELYRFFANRRGLFFAAGAVCWHLFYYFYSGLSFVLCWFYYKTRSLFRSAHPYNKKNATELN